MRELVTIANYLLSGNGTSAFARWSRALCCLAVVIFTRVASAAPPPADGSLASSRKTGVRVEATPIGDGAEVLTLFVTIPADEGAHYREMPVLSVLRDTLGSTDSESERLRDVWLLTAGRPSAVHRVESALPFLYLIHTPKPSSSTQPVRLIDFGAPVRQTETALAGMVLQGEMLDPAGRTLRTTSRSYRMNDADDRSARAAEAVAAIADAEDDPNTPPSVTDDLARIHARLLLCDSVLGGLVREQRLLSYHDLEQTQREITRGHNWDLLRQAAETDQLYFEPLTFGGDQPAYALLWVRTHDLRNPPKRFDGRLLHIANPFHDHRLAQWRGYSEDWHFDPAGRRIDEETVDGINDKVIPLALYSLDHPHVPLLLIDFQNGGAPRRRESAGQAADDVTRGLLGLSPIANWNYFVARSFYTFVQRRHGAAEDRNARVRAWAELSYALSAGDEIRPGLRQALEKHVHAPVFDSTDNRIDMEAKLAWERWRLLTGSESPVPRIVEADRSTELAALEHGAFVRAGMSLAHTASLGAYEKKQATPDTLPQLAWERKLQWNRDFLENVARSSPRIEVTWDPELIRAAVQQVADLVHARALTSDNISPVLAQLVINTQDDDIRHLCLNTLSLIDTNEAKQQLADLSRRNFDCPVCREYLARRSVPAPPAATATFAGGAE